MTTTIAEYSQTEAGLAKLREDYEGAVYDVTTKDGMECARAARALIRGYRTDLETLRKEIKGPALKRCRDIDGEAKRITAELRALEDPIDAQIKEETERKKREKEEAALAEASRVAAIKKRIFDIERVPLGMVGCSSDEISSAIRSLESSDFDVKEFEEFAPEFVAVFAESLGKTKALYESTVQEEQGRAELERLKAEQEARAKEEQARIAAEVRARAEADAESRRKIEEQERKARERIEAEERAARAAREKQEAEARAKQAAEDERLRKERERAEAEERKRREKIEKEEREARERIEREERAARELREAEEAKARAARIAEEEKERQRLAKQEAERAKREAAERKARLEKEELERKVREASEKKQREEREKAEAIEREKQRKEAERMDARHLLGRFLDRFAHIEEFAGIVAAIDEYRKGQTL
jgi:IgA-specific serine endopeptidase